MHKYGPTALTKRVAIKDDLGKLICCTSKLPDPSEASEDAVMQLTQPQKGYVTSHFYRLVSGKWIDVTDECGPIERKVAGDLNVEYEVFFSTKEAWATGYLDIWWTEAQDSTDAGALLYEVVVRKPCILGEDSKPSNYPVDPTDGEIVVRKAKGIAWKDELGNMQASYTREHPYRFDDVTYGTDMQDKYCYRLFHVYASGWWSYVNGPYLNQIREKN